MGAVTIQQMADRVSELMDERLAVRGGNLAAKLRNAGRRLPRRVREAGDKLASAAEQSRHPKLLGRIDLGEVAENYDVCVRHLTGIDPADRKRQIVGSILRSIGFGVLFTGALVIAFLVWRGYL